MHLQHVSKLDESFFQSLRNFVLIFFYDMLIYIKFGKCMYNMVLKLLEEEQLYVKPSMCSFGFQEVEYFGYIVSHEGVKVGLKKIKLRWNGLFP
jgi:hypothetical protein